ncbi:uncharacterized protein J3D65DRAFT_598831 [Phyllosticta citribraziliensis]|uniref:Uncharacterized protein n=1 Tax=Phyllosticta citribraziliensis TaxID=989973 RepID=A0ABR1M8G6_9PEZI
MPKAFLLPKPVTMFSPCPSEPSSSHVPSRVQYGTDQRYPQVQVPCMRCSPLLAFCPSGSSCPLAEKIIITATPEATRKHDFIATAANKNRQPAGLTRVLTLQLIAGLYLRLRDSTAALNTVPSSLRSCVVLPCALSRASWYPWILKPVDAVCVIPKRTESMRLLRSVWTFLIRGPKYYKGDNSDVHAHNPFRSDRSTVRPSS